MNSLKLRIFLVHFTCTFHILGTRCSSSGKVCNAGQCVQKPEVPQPSSNDVAKWSPWSDFSACRSGCILKSTGYQERTRYCIYPPQAPAATAGGCRGQAIQVRTCSNPSACSATHSPDKYATKVIIVLCVYSQ